MTLAKFLYRFRIEWIIKQAQQNKTHNRWSIMMIRLFIDLYIYNDVDMFVWLKQQLCLWLCFTKVFEYHYIHRGTFCTNNPLCNNVSRSGAGFIVYCKLKCNVKWSIKFYSNVTMYLCEDLIYHWILISNCNVIHDPVYKTSSIKTV